MKIIKTASTPFIASWCHFTLYLFIKQTLRDLTLYLTRKNDTPLWLAGEISG